jgi:ABC-type enterobactin transport system permease subunit
LPEDDAALLKPLASPDDATFDAGAYAGRVLAEATSSEEVSREREVEVEMKRH